MKATYGNHNEKTSYFPIRLPHDLRKELDQASRITGQSRAKIMFDATRLHLAELLKNTPSTTPVALES